MIVEWDLYCDWAITIYEIGTSMILTFYLYASIGALDHYYMGYLNPRLEAKAVRKIAAENKDKLGQNGL